MDRGCRGSDGDSTQCVCIGVRTGTTAWWVSWPRILTFLVAGDACCTARYGFITFNAPSLALVAAIARLMMRASRCHNLLEIGTLTVEILHFDEVTAPYIMTIECKPRQAAKQLQSVILGGQRLGRDYLQ